VPPAEPFLQGVTSLVAAAGDAPADVVVRRIAEPIQVDVELLARLHEAGVVPGARLRAHRDGGAVVIGRDGGDLALELHDDVARHVFVQVN